jgi:hypothetical protein
MAWHKYLLVPKSPAPNVHGIDQTPEDHVVAYGGLNAFSSRIGTTDFFSYFMSPDFHYGRLFNYDQFLRKFLTRDMKILSIASGHAVNELYLLQDGFQITCSDLKHFIYHDQVKKHFCEFEFLELNILDGATHHKYDTAMILGLIYLFDENQLKSVMKNVRECLKPKGRFILEVTGAPQNFASYFFHEVYLKYEAKLLQAMYRLLGRNLTVTKKHHGFRRSDSEVLELARKADFRLVAHETFDYVAEFQRSYIISRLLTAAPFLRALILSMGKLFGISYIRIFVFEKN